MATVLGKRKRVRRAEAIDAEVHDLQGDPDQDRDALQAAFQKAFEQRFAPLDAVKKPAVVESRAELEEEESDSAEDTDGFEGFSSAEEEEEEEEEDSHGEPAVEVFDYANTQGMNVLSPADAKAFMSSKPPLIGADTVMRNKAIGMTGQGEDDKTEKLNLKNDLALQRLISESHLLEKTKDGSPSGHRQRITEMRLQSLGSKGSILVQEKMPMSHRKGITTKAREKEGRRRAEAKENGIILERAAAVKKAEVKRTRGVGGPSVGSFKGGTLKLTKGDVSSIKSTKVTREGRRRR